MQLLDLPPELLHVILTEAVLIRGLKRAMRLRLINRQFSEEITRVVFETHLPDASNKYNICKHPYWQSYLAYRVLAETKRTSSLLTTIRYTAEVLYHSEGNSDDKILCAYVKSLCSLASDRMKHTSLQHVEFNEAACRKHLLAAAAHANNLPLVAQLLAEGYSAVEPSSMFGSPIEAAAHKGNNQILELFLSRGAEGRVAALRGAFDGGRLDTLNLVLDARWGHISPTHITYSKALKEGLRTKDPEIFAFVTQLMGLPPKSFALASLLSQAVAHRHSEMVRYLLDIGAPVNGDKDNALANPLRSASLKGYTEIVKLLIERGARPRLGWGDTLTSAAKYGYLDVVTMLLKHGANVNEKPTEDLRAPPAIVSAIQLEHEEMFFFLRKRGAVLNTPETGVKALKMAIEEGLESMVVLLLEEGVDADGTYVGIAMEHGHNEIVRILHQHMGKARKTSTLGILLQAW